MQKVIVGILALALVGVAVLLVSEHQKVVRLSQDNEASRQQVAQVRDLTIDNERLSNLVAQAATAQTSDQKELSRLRREMAGLRGQSNELVKLRSENAGLRQQQPRAPALPQPEQLDSPEAQQRRAAIARMNDAKQLVFGLMMFANDNQGRFPAAFEDAKQYFGSDSRSLSQMNQFDLLYKGSLQDLADPSTAIVIRETQTWPGPNGNWIRAYGFADGHVEVHSTPDGNFGPWEDQHRARLKGQ
jgi:prepilin-type processing-associated H-X9-DG protein